MLPLFGIAMDDDAWFLGPCDANGVYLQEIEDMRESYTRNAGSFRGLPAWRNAGGFQNSG